MSVTLIRSEWVSGNLVFYEDQVGQSVTGDVLTIGTTAVKIGETSQDVDFQFYATGSKSFIIDAGAGTMTLLGIAPVIGANAAGLDFTLYGAVTAYKAWWDANGDTNGAFYFGADTKGVQVSLYGDVTGCGVFWDPTTDTNGTLTIGGSGGAKGNDVIAYGATNGKYVKWDQSANNLLIYGNNAGAGSLTASVLTVYATGTAGQQDVGIAAYIDATAIGQSTANWTYGAGIWLNLDVDWKQNLSGGWGGHEQVTPLSVGVYAPDLIGTDVNDTDIIYGIKAELVGQVAFPTTNGCYFAALNVNQTAATRTAIFFAHQQEAVGKTTAKSVAAGAVALVDINGTMHYVNTFTS